MAVIFNINIFNALYFLSKSIHSTWLRIDTEFAEVSKNPAVRDSLIRPKKTSNQHSKIFAARLSLAVRPSFSRTSLLL